MIRKDIQQGQISIFDLEFTQPQEPKQELKPISKPKENHNKFTEIINLYSSTATRIVKQISGALLVELQDRTLYFNSAGINELELKKDMELMPADEILVVNQDRKLNELQLKKLADMQVTEYIKRRGDSNIIIPMPEKTIVINPQGWVLDYKQKPKYAEEEFFSTERAKQNTDLDNKVTESAVNIAKSVNESTEFENDVYEKVDLDVGDKVKFNYDGGSQVGHITSIYNNGETVNVVWDHKHTAFYYKCVKKVS